MTSLNRIRLKKGEDRRLRQGHPWIFSNEINTTLTPLKSFTPGEEVIVEAHDGRLLGVAYLNPHSLIAGRLFSHDIEQRLTTDFFIQRFKDALALRKRLFPRPYYRLVFSEADGLPGLIIDRFGNDLVAQLNTAGMDVKKNSVLEALSTVLPHTTSILLRNDSSIRQYENLPIEIIAGLGTPPDDVQLEENGIAFIAPLLKGQKTGWFYDHRLNRARLAAYVANRKVLDVFSYLGSFGIHAAHYGASTVDCIETSRFAADFIVRNAQLNQVSANVNVICDDAFDAMKQLDNQQQKYDVIILDPPAFIKKQKDRQAGLVAYQRINELALKLLNKGGILLSCSCSMHLGTDDLTNLLERAAARTQSTIQLLEQGHQGPDHPIYLSIPETNYLKAFVIRKM